jgi:hypothetical protein
MAEKDKNLKQTLTLCSISYVSDVADGSSSVIPLGLIARVDVKDHSGLATAVRATLTPEEVGKVGRLIRDQLRSPNAMLMPLFEEIAQAPDAFEELPLRHSGSLRFSNPVVRIEDVPDSLATLPDESFVTAVKTKVSERLKAELASYMRNGEDVAASQPKRASSVKQSYVTLLAAVGH